MSPMLREERLKATHGKSKEKLLFRSVPGTRQTDGSSPSPGPLKREVIGSLLFAL